MDITVTNGGIAVDIQSYISPEAPNYCFNFNLKDLDDILGDFNPEQIRLALEGAFNVIGLTSFNLGPEFKPDTIPTFMDEEGTEETFGIAESMEDMVAGLKNEYSSYMVDAAGATVLNYENPELIDVVQLELCESNEMVLDELIETIKKDLFFVPSPFFPNERSLNTANVNSFGLFVAENNRFLVSAYKYDGYNDILLIWFKPMW